MTHRALCLLLLASCSKLGGPLLPTGLEDGGQSPSSQMDSGQPGRSDAGVEGDASAEDSGSEDAQAFSRESLVPQFQLIPRSEYGRIQRKGRTMTDDDFHAGAVGISVAEKLEQIRDLLPEGALEISIQDQQRAQRMPFRGNPSDAKAIQVGGRTKVYVPLGGHLTMPGDEVAVVVDHQLEARIRVGLRPQRLAVHPEGKIFVCNQYSNYLSIIDPVTDQALRQSVPTEYFCADLVFVPNDPSAPSSSDQVLLVANRSGTVLRSRVRTQPDGSFEVEPPQPIFGVGFSPWRLAVSEEQDAVIVTSNKAGAVARIDMSTGAMVGQVRIGAPSADAVVIDERIFIPTTTPDRGLLSRDDDVPGSMQAADVEVLGLDGQLYQIHPGALFDGTMAYDFEDLRNGILVLPGLSGTPRYYTDDVTPEPSFAPEQKILGGALPTAVIRNRDGTAIYVALSGSRLVQELSVGAAPFELTASGKFFHTGHRPYALALDEKEETLYVASWGSDTLEAFDLASGGGAIATVDLGYASPAYPASNVERGELLFYDASWSNNGRKACAGCHFEELVTDGLSYSNGTQAPTALHQVRPHHNLFATGPYFNNGSYGAGTFASYAFKAQTRSNCELIARGFVEGLGSDPAVRIGDPSNRYASVADLQCRPVVVGGELLNRDDVQRIIEEEGVVAAQGIQAATGFETDEVQSFLDFYAASELRLPPNPLRQRYQRDRVDSYTRTMIEMGEILYEDSDCGACHVPDNGYLDSLNHGAGADWLDRFVQRYQNQFQLPFTMLAAAGSGASGPTPEVTLFLEPIQSLAPLCFDASSCVEFLDPLAVLANSVEEARRLELLVRWGFLGPELDFIPGSFRGAPALNTPSLRGVWTETSLLHHGLATSIESAILAPGHPASGPDGAGFAWSNDWEVHGKTAELTPEEVRALVLFVKSIE